MNAVAPLDASQSFYSAPVNGASAAERQHWERFINAPNIGGFHLRDERRRLEQLAALGDNWDGNGSLAPSETAIRRAAGMVLPFLYDSVSTLERKWAIPHIAASELGEVVLEWWHGDRKVTLYVSDTSVECIRVWGTDIDTEMEAKELLSSQDFRSIWAWLFD